MAKTACSLVAVTFVVAWTAQRAPFQRRSLVAEFSVAQPPLHLVAHVSRSLLAADRDYPTLYRRHFWQERGSEGEGEASA
jgi:hypothetical protein